MLSYETPRNLGLSLNLQNTTSQTSSDAEQHEHDETIDENTQLLQIERQEYVSTKLNGNRMNITNNNLCNINLVSSNLQNNNSLSKKNESKLIEDEEEDSVTVDENSVNNNDDSNLSDKLVGDGTEGKKIIKMTKLGSKNVTLKR